jgi:hydroxylamine reductase
LGFIYFLDLRVDIASSCFRFFLAASSPAARALPLLARAASNATMPATKEPIMENSLFCMQCEQTKNGTGCTTIGVCGKTPEVNALQELLVYSQKGLSCWAQFAKENNVPLPDTLASFLHASTFSTLTNVNFDASRYREYITECHALRDEIEARLRSAGIEDAPASPTDLPWFDLLAHPARWNLSASYLASATNDALVKMGQMVSLEHKRHIMDPTLLGLQEMLVYGIRGLCAYTHHAEVLGKRVPEADDFVAEAYAFLCSRDAASIDKTLGMILKCGEVNLLTMKGLSEGHTGRFGHPVPTAVNLNPVAGKAILISGHDMQDLHDLLVQTEGTGIQVYTHGEMLPGHGYPGLKKFQHLAGNYGGAWYKQQKEFERFPGPVVMTSNCIIEPRESYATNIYTTGEVGWPGVTYIPYAHDGIGATKDYSSVIKKALEMDGFSENDVPAEPKTVLTGFGHNAILGVADKVVDAVKTGKLSHIFVMGGCDGKEPSRRYFGQSADLTPDDTMILGLGCGKFRFYDHEFGNLKDTGLPRYLDIGQCNDAYSGVVVASALAEAFETDINGLPLSFNLSWLEQKAVVILLSLLHLGVKNIRIGPNAPAFVTPEALAVLVDKFNLQITDVKHPEADMEAMLAGH